MLGEKDGAQCALVGLQRSPNSDESVSFKMVQSFQNVKSKDRFFPSICFVGYVTFAFLFTYNYFWFMYNYDIYHKDFKT